MTPQELSKAMHDLRAPLARAKTLAKLFLEAAPGEMRPEEVQARMAELLHDLEELDRQLNSLVR